MSIPALSSRTAPCYPVNASNTQCPLLGRLRDSYISVIQAFSQKLFQKGWIIPHYLVGSLLAEPCESQAAGYRRLWGWQTSWAKHGFYDAAKEADLKRLEIALKAEMLAKDFPGAPARPPLPLFLLHGDHGSPDAWLPWADTLKAAKEEGKIGHVITMQLPNEMKARQALVRTTIKKISDIYARALNLPPGEFQQLNLMGHSKGGYAAHLAAFETELIYDKDRVERRWHCEDKRNPLVHKVISVAAPTWLCCMQHKDANHPENQDIYPLSGFTASQLETIQNCHRNIYDIVAEEDAISITNSPLPESQVIKVKHGHIGASTCPDVCRLAISILNT